MPRKILSSLFSQRAPLWLLGCLVFTVTVLFGHPILKHPPLLAQTVNSAEVLPSPLPPIAPPANLSITQQGEQLTLNGRTFTAPWIQWQDGHTLHTALSDMAVWQVLGVELLSTEDPTKQPVAWFSHRGSNPLTLNATLLNAYRYLDITEILNQVNSTSQTQGNTLNLTFPPAQVQDIQEVEQGDRKQIIVQLDRPTFWQMSQNPTEAVIMLEGSIQARHETPTEEEQPKNLFDKLQNILTTQGNGTTPPPPEIKPLLSKVEGTDGRRGRLFINLPANHQVNLSSLSQPNRLIVNVTPEGLVERDIVWAPGIRWRQTYIPLAESRFPISALEFDARNPKIALRPIWGNPPSMIGTDPLITMGRQWQAFAAINGGFFNRDNRLPLGAIRRDGKWFSGPILNRGVIAWDDRGNVNIGRLYLRETLVTGDRQRLNIPYLNSGYVQAGLARYTPEWGNSYTPLTDNEIIVLVQNNSITQQYNGGPVNQTPFPIPRDGYLLTIRGRAVNPQILRPGLTVTLESETVPATFANYPQIIGAGPLLLQNRQIVLNGEAERFSAAFNQQAASRSLIGMTAQGKLIIAAIHNRTGGRGPTLPELARLAQQLGMTDALNLDGGSSTSLYIGGQLVDRSPVTAARVHNGIGVYITQ
ncbi:phosphodiester glycosidase family protein [Spirulina subsalsa FACHB-351]|uniref:Phosphodiester glycosidase family protein n=1 Tax=Spirulina subsalsa FACHB-351 TaxID=234711 RepID=A0ABT3L0Z3_9CYAN|nr:phosphodiester glycosidase family protein [Spirulina subsalsa]MCW6035180.1 phosphodiester glycosidase family protein [Spirulina subsalsa FACHB-351]